MNKRRIKQIAVIGTALIATGLLAYKLGYAMSEYDFIKDIYANGGELISEFSSFGKEVAVYSHIES